MEPRVVINEYNMSMDHMDNLAVNLVLIHDKNGERHEYSFTGRRVNKEEWNECQSIISEHEGNLPLDPARRVWDLLVKNCEFRHTSEKKGSLWG